MLALCVMLTGFLCATPQYSQVVDVRSILVVVDAQGRPVPPRLQERAAARRALGAHITVEDSDSIAEVLSTGMRRSCLDGRCVYYLKRCQAWTCDYVFGWRDDGQAGPDEPFALRTWPARIQATSAAALRRAQRNLGLVLPGQEPGLQFPLAALSETTDRIEPLRCSNQRPEPGCPTFRMDPGH